MTERVQRMSSTRWTTDEFSPFSLCLPLFFFPRGLFVCAQPVPLESFCLNDYNKIMRLICKGGALWIFQKYEIH